MIPGNDALKPEKSKMPKIIIALLITLCFIAGVAAGCEELNRIEYIQGSRVGYIVKFAKRGLFWKSYQGEVNMGGVQNTGIGGASPSVWNFSLDNQRRRGENIDSLVKVINVFLSTGQAVIFTYYAPFYSWPWRSNGRYLVQSVRAIPRD
jgi:hypothetical protein